MKKGGRTIASRMKPSSETGSIERYIAGFPEDVQPKLNRVWRTIRKALPNAEESISYGIPTFKITRPVIYFGGFKSHISIFPMIGDVQKKFAKELSGYEMSKGTVRFPLDEPIPYELVAKIAKYRAQVVAEQVASKKKR